MRVQKNRNLGLNWDADTTGGFFANYFLDPRRARKVTITFSDDQVFKFEARMNPEAQFGAPITAGTVVYQPTDDTHATLESVGGDDVSVAGSVPGSVDLIDIGTGGVYNPTLFRLTTREGTVMIVSETDGLLSLTDRNGNGLTIDGNGVIHSSGKSVVFTRDGQNRITHVTDPNGEQLVYSYDVDGRLETFTDRELNVTAFNYQDVDFPNYLTEILDPRGVQAIRTEFDDDGRMIKQIDADGNAIEFTHDLSANAEIIKDREGNVTVHEYDERGNITRTIDALMNETLYTYDFNDNELTVTDALGNVTTKTYDASDNMLTETQWVTAPDGMVVQAVTSYAYDDFNNPLSITDANGNVTFFEYDGAGNMIRQIDGEGFETLFGYDGVGNLTSMTDAEGNVTDYTYDADGNQLSMTVTDAFGMVLRSESYTYDTNGNQLTSTTSRTLPDSSVQTLLTTYEYDNENRLIRTIHPDNTVEEIVYNSIGKEAIRRDQLLRETVMEYDDRGNLFRTTYPDLTTMEMGYDLENREISRTDQLGRTTCVIGVLDFVAIAEGGAQDADRIGPVSLDFEMNAAIGFQGGYTESQLINM